MLVLNKKIKIVCAALVFILIAAAGYLAEKFENDAFVAETVAKEDAVSYTEADDSEDNGLININTAGAEELVELNGIGEEYANRIIKYRNENGRFETIEEIMKVSGISEKKFADIKDFICTE